ncbi:MAG: sortase [Clostridia bacterium]|nr:sortase [Clostridia bacterium]
MIDKKYSKVLNIVLIISAVILVVGLGVWGFTIYQQYNTNKEAGEAVDDFITDRSKNKTNTVGDVSLNVNDLDISNYAGDNSKLAKKTYKGFTMDGILEIPKINLRYPILDRATDASMKVAVGINYGTLNKVGNTVIMGHNSKNGLFFSNLNKLSKGDPVYVTDNDDLKIKYIIYNIYETSAEDLDYFTRDTAGKREISLSTCLEDSSQRLVIWAREEEQNQ